MEGTGKTPPVRSPAGEEERHFNPTTSGTNEQYHDLCTPAYINKYGAVLRSNRGISVSRLMLCRDMASCPDPPRRTKGSHAKTAAKSAGCYRLRKSRNVVILSEAKDLSVQ
jgi:hypothetical protein